MASWENGVKPQLRNSTRWNSQNDCIDTFLKNYLMLLEISMEHESELYKNIVAIIKNAAVHMEAMNLQKWLKIVLDALNAMQRTALWVRLCMFGYNCSKLEPYNQIIRNIFNQCITPLHLVAFQKHPLYEGGKILYIWPQPTFGLYIWPQLRKLGNEKRENLVMCHRTLRDENCDDW